MKVSMKWPSIALALSPCLTPYIISSLKTTLASVILILAILKVLFSQRSKGLSQSLELKFFIMILILSLFTLTVNINSSWFNLSTFINNFFTISITFGALIFVSPNVDIKPFKKTLYIMSILAAIIVLYQRASLFATGTFNRDFYLPFFTLAEDIAEVNRPSAFFKEPAHLSQYIAPVFYIALVDKKFLLSVLFCMAILASGSTTGFLLLPILFLVWFFHNSGNKSQKIIAIFLVVIAYYTLRDFIDSLLGENMDKADKTGDESNIRLLGGLVFFKYFSITQKIFGIGFNQLSYFFGVNSGVTNYSNGIIFMTISYGYIGLISLIAYLAKVYNKYQPLIGFFVILIGVFCTSQLLFSTTLLYLLTFCILGRKLNS